MHANELGWAAQQIPHTDCINSDATVRLLAPLLLPCSDSIQHFHRGKHRNEASTHNTNIRIDPFVNINCIIIRIFNVHMDIQLRWHKWVTRMVVYGLDRA